MQVLVLQVRPRSQLGPAAQQGRPCMPQSSALVAEKVAVAAAPLVKLLPLAVFVILRGLKLAVQ